MKKTKQKTEMNIIHNFKGIYVLASAVALTAATASGQAATAAPGQDNTPRKSIFQNNNRRSRTYLQKENRRLESVIDSLEAELSRYHDEMRINDSIADEIMDIYDENEDKSAAGLNPEDYTAEVSDSLLNIWYLHNQISSQEVPEYDMDSVRFESNVPDEIYIARLKAMNSYIPLPYNDIVKNYIILYSEKMPSRMPKILGLAQYYMPLFEEILNEHDVPEELKAMAVIESALNPTAVSRAGAKGMWQFMYSTAKLYGLHIDSFVDERLDPVKSAHAAAEYLKDAYNIFGDWNLAIASYNCGAGNVNRAIRRSGGKRNFWDIYPYLPRETRGYVPAFVGALYTMTYYKEHGIVPENIEIPAHIDTFHIHKMLHFKQVSALTGAPEQELKNLNPQYRHEIVPGNDRDYILRLPYTYTNAFIDNEDSLYTYKADEYFNPVVIKKIKDGGDGERIIHRVRSGEVLGRIAMRYHVSVRQIKRWNNLRSDNIRIGQRLVIYRGGNGPATSTASASSSSSSSSAAKSVTAQKSAAQNSGQNSNAAYTIYVVKSGDSLYSIAKHYPGISAQNIMDYNGISSKIKPGMKIKIPKKA